MQGISKENPAFHCSFFQEDASMKTCLLCVALGSKLLVELHLLARNLRQVILVVLGTQLLQCKMKSKKYLLRRVVVRIQWIACMLKHIT